tara:strand:- start:3080 stop:3316 length:237 start_codon:yes stop_codon:yes gene_type:complete
MKKLILLLLFIPLVSCGDDEEILGNCVVAPDLNRVCTKEYQPVCACNGIVYGNACEAEREGNSKWKSTNKDAGEECNF